MSDPNDLKPAGIGQGTLGDPRYEDELGFVAPLPLSHGPRKLAPEGFETGPAIGERLPDFTLTDQHSRAIQLHGDRGNARAAVVFFRSAVW